MGVQHGYSTHGGVPGCCEQAEALHAAASGSDMWAQAFNDSCADGGMRRLLAWVITTSISPTSSLDRVRACGDADAEALAAFGWASCDGAVCLRCSGTLAEGGDAIGAVATSSLRVMGAVGFASAMFSMRAALPADGGASEAMCSASNGWAFAAVFTLACGRAIPACGWLTT